MELTSTFMDLLAGFRPVFTNPTFVTFELLMTGWILSVQHPRQVVLHPSLPSSSNKSLERTRPRRATPLSFDVGERC